MGIGIRNNGGGSKVTIDGEKVCLATKGSELHNRIYSKTYLKEVV